MRQDETSRQRSPLQLIKMDPLYARRDITRVQYLQCKEEEYRDRGICKSPLATRCMRAMSNITRQPFTRSHLADECTYCCAEQVKETQ